MPNETFSKRIKVLRANKGLSMDDLARELGITKSRISMWENNGVVPRTDLLQRLSQYFGVTVDYLLGNDHIENQKPESVTLSVLQRGLNEMNEQELEKAKNILSVVFTDIFNDSVPEDDDEDL